MPSPNEPSSAVRAEQPVVAAMYDRLDELTTRASRDLNRAKRAATAGTPAAQVEREAMIRVYNTRLGALVSAERRLCFGRLDFSAGGAPVYIGRLSLADEKQSLLLTDWRAPAAEPFYRATTATPMGVSRRRHILLSAREVSAVEDDVLDLDAVDADSSYEGNGALMAALAARRTGRMGDIVATIQAEQDRIIRAPMPGILVVEGGPGCGKTVVGLHRAAYLLYTHRNQIARSGVLVVGPNALFLRYISQVLPGLGESAAVLATPGQLYPEVEASPEVSDQVAAIKGDLRMAEVVAAAIRNRQRVPDSTRPLTVAGTRITMSPALVSAARDRARASRKPHNRARLTFVTSVLDRLALALAEARGVDPDSNRDILLGDLRDSPDVRREVNLCWMPLTPEQVIADLWSGARVLAAAAPRLSRRERELLARPAGEPWTVSDVPLLDEAAELLGEDDEPARRAAAVAASERVQEEEYARGVLEMTGVAGLTAGALIDRYTGAQRVRRTVVDAALADRTWVFGHVVVDEAQELSPMQWRLLLRRCPSRSMTVVGDLAQAGSSAAPRTWGDVFDRVAPGRWSVQPLTVNYRTPAPMMQLATRVLAASGSPVTEPSSVRDGTPPRVIRVAAGPADAGAGSGRTPTGGRWEDPPTALADAAGKEIAGWLGDEGRTAVIVPRALRDPIARVLTDSVPSGTLGVGNAALDTRVSLLTVAEAKGLEFDQVVVVEPALMLSESVRGGHDLYVALTRATQELVVLHAADLPAGFDAG
ncbi:MAG TPA: ATP-binding domain-containing protein [Motilibacterales bacterium]|nr:ATP-binding domain-containing protein [Motilibacterales bacterium]